MGVFDVFRTRAEAASPGPAFVPPASARTGVLPPDGPATVGGIALPGGRLIKADPAFGSTLTEPLFWCTGDSHGPPGVLLNSLRHAFPGSGLWPMALMGLQADDPQRPWYDGEFEPVTGAVQRIDSVNVEAMLAVQWEAAFPEEGRFPGLAKVDGPWADRLDAFYADAAPTLIGLIAVHRPADAPAALGWTGAINTPLHPVDMSAVLRSWEERFGAVLVQMGFDTIDLAVARPARTAKEALAVAAELAAFCPDSVHQGARSVKTLAERLVGAERWSFWWD